MSADEMYLLQEFDLLPLLILLASWAVGGWLITARLFDLPPVERHLVGLGVGMVVSNWLANFLARLLPLPIAFWLSAAGVLGIGIGLALPIWRDMRSMFTPAWGQWTAFVLLAFLFTLINRGLAILDDYAHLPTLSVMAAGDIPPHFPLNVDTGFRYSYHYFLLLLGAQFMRLTHAAPWTALDMARGMTMALSFLLAGLFAYRLTGHPQAQFWGSAFAALAGGTRWLLLLLPPSLVTALSNSVTLIGSTAQETATLQSLLYGPWMIDGAGPVPFPFAFTNSVFRPGIMALGGNGAWGNVILLLLLLVAPRLKHTWGWPLMAVLLSALALTDEVFFAFAGVGFLGMLAWWLMRRRTLHLPTSLTGWALTFFTAGLLALGQGGVLTEWLRSLFIHPEGIEFSDYVIRFRVAWPPVLISPHFGRLSFFTPLQLLLALIEIGPIFLVLPLVFSRGKEQFTKENWLEAGIIFSIIISLLALFVENTGMGGLRETTRLFGYSLTLCVLYAVPLVSIFLQKRGRVFHALFLTGGMVCVLGGAVLLSVQLYAISKPVASYYLDELDVQMYEKYWDRLPPRAMIFDPLAWRSPTLFGRATNAHFTWYIAKPEFEALAGTPDPYAVHAAGFDYMYYNLYYWLQHKDVLDQPCVKILDQVTDIHQATGESGNFRRLVDISACVR